MKKYDVVIVGAGPGGLSCARNLSGSGLKVLVLEKNEKLGMKICSGEISPKVLPDEEFDRGHEWREMTIGTDETTRTVKFDKPYLWTIGRFEFESYLKKGCDAEIKFSEPATKITKKYVETKKGKYEYKHLVGADGSFSVVRKHLNLPVTNIAGWAYHFIVNKPAKEFHLYWLPKSFPGSYGYMMSKSRDQTMIGVAQVKPDFDHEFAAKAKSWVKKRFKLKVDKLKSEAMKGNADYRGWEFDNTYLVGDAGGFLNPCTTEGIYYAVKSGEGVAKHILGKPEGAKIMSNLASAHNWQVLMFDLATNTSLPFCWGINWILEDPRSGIRKRIFDFVLWKFMDG